MTHLKQNKQASAFTKGAAAVLLASCSWALPAVAADDAMTDLLTVLRQRGSISEAEYQRMKPHADKEATAASQALTKDLLKKEWFGKMAIRGYVQTRYTHVLGSGMDGTGVNTLHSPTEPNISERDSFFMRRARMIFSGDVHDHLYLYAQLDWQAGVGGSYSETNASGLQTRDMYGDISLDHDKEHRIRLGVSKVPYGWVNLQSSQNRLSIERPEALNSAVEGERDLGMYYMWADKTARARFRELVQLGLKGSGDYGVFTVGAYNGQGLNKYDSNRAPHVVARAAYPFKLDNGQFFEVGLGGYQGKFVVNPTSGKSATQYTDRRVAANFVWFPQPFGFEAEWTYGEGPQTVTHTDANGKLVPQASYKVSQEELHGGYCLINYKIDTDIGTVIPFIRWSYFDGGRKFQNNSSTTTTAATTGTPPVYTTKLTTAADLTKDYLNAPTQRVSEMDLGVEYQPWSSFEVALLYTRSFWRTNTSTGNLARDVDRVTCQLQYNF